MNVRIVLESINSQSQRADCLCTEHACSGYFHSSGDGDGVRGVCAWLVDALGIRTMWPCVFDRISDAVVLKSVLACQVLV